MRNRPLGLGSLISGGVVSIRLRFWLAILDAAHTFALHGASTCGSWRERAARPNGGIDEPRRLRDAIVLPDDGIVRRGRNFIPGSGRCRAARSALGLEALG